MIPGTTIRSGVDPTCPECGITPKLQVLSSAAGYYIGTWCDCGPYSRESDYYRTRQAAQSALDTDTVNWR